MIETVQVPAVEPLSSEEAALMKHMVLEALRDAHDSKIKPEAFFAVIKQAAYVLSALEAAFAMNNVLDILKLNLAAEATFNGVSAAVSLSTLDARRSYVKLHEDMRLVQVTRLRDPASIN